MAPVRTAIIGLGYFGPNLLRNFAAQSDCEMVMACDIKEDHLNKVKRTYPSVQCTTDAEDIFKDPSIELVLIATPTSAHFPLAKKALESGKHVLIEKPITSTVAEADELIALAKKQNLMIFTDHTFCFAPAVEKMASYVEKKDLGDLLYFDSVRINLGLIQKDTNVLYDLAIHDLSILSRFMNLRDIRTITAHGAKYFGAQEEVAHLYLEFQSGFTAHIHVSWLSPVKIRQTILAGKRAMLTYDDTEPSEKLRLYDRGVEHDTTRADPMLPVYRSGDVLIPALPTKETLAIEADHVLKCIREKETPRVSGEAGRDVLQVLERATESMRTGKTLTFA